MDGPNALHRGRILTAPRRRVALPFTLALCLPFCLAALPPDPAPQLRPIRGEEHKALVVEDDTLLDVAYRHRLGFGAVARLNPEVDEWIPDPGTVVRLPLRYVLPNTPEEGLVINVPEMRLYDFTAPTGLEVLAVAIGDGEDRTPLGAFRIGAKRTNPAWNVPRSIREERPELPAVVPPGPDNPLGQRWLTIGTSSYGIHGTNIRWSIGRMATHGCVRLYEDDVMRIYDRVSSGTPVRIVYQRFKWGRDGQDLYLEVHPDVYELDPTPLTSALATPRALGLLDSVDLNAVSHAVLEARGVPVHVGRLAPLILEPAADTRPGP